MMRRCVSSALTRSRRQPSVGRPSSGVLARCSSSESEELISSLASMPTTPLSLRSMYETGVERDTLAACRFLHSELPIRMAQRIQELRQLPMGLSSHESIVRIVQYYEQAVEELVQHRFPETAEDEESFAQMVARLMSATTVPESIYAAVRAATSSSKVVSERELSLTKYTAARLNLDMALSRFFTARVGLRMLVEHYLELRRPEGRQQDDEGRVGIIHGRCRPAQVAREAIAEVEAIFARSPPVTMINGRSVIRTAPRVLIAGDLDAECTYVRGHMHQALLELLKNSSRAVSARHTDQIVPPLKLVIAAGTEDVTIKLEDLGGGFERSARHMMYSWFWSDQEASGPLSSMGIGLPYTRVLARYFGGELSLRPMEGYGTDTYLHLERLGTNCENLPAPVLHSPAMSDSTLPAGHSFFDDDRPIIQQKIKLPKNAKATFKLPGR